MPRCHEAAFPLVASTGSSNLQAVRISSHCADRNVGWCQEKCAYVICAQTKGSEGNRLMEGERV